MVAFAAAPAVECPRCATVHNVTDRREDMLDAIWNMTLPAVDLAAAVNAILRQPVVDAATIRQWKKRGVIEPAGVDTKGRPLYLVSDVVSRALRPTGDTPAR